MNGGDALRCARELARKEGIFVGTSSGATFAGALEVCKSAPPGANVLCMLPDTGERYLSTPLFADIPADMTRRGARDLALDAALPLRRAAAGSRAPAPPKAPEPRRRSRRRPPRSSPRSRATPSSPS